jgi:hypothetical protein
MAAQDDPDRDRQQRHPRLPSEPGRAGSESRDVTGLPQFPFGEDHEWAPGREIAQPGPRFRIPEHAETAHEPHSLQIALLHQETGSPAVERHRCRRDERIPPAVVIGRPHERSCRHRSSNRDAAKSMPDHPKKVPVLKPGEHRHRVRREKSSGHGAHSPSIIDAKIDASIARRAWS